MSTIARLLRGLRMDWGTAGGLLYRDADGNVQTLAPGTAGLVVTSTGGGFTTAAPSGGGGGGGSTTLPASGQLLIEYRADSPDWPADPTTGATAILKDEWKWLRHAGAQTAGVLTANVVNSKPGLLLTTSPNAGYDTGIAIGAPYTIVVVFRVHSTGLTGNHRVIQGQSNNFIVGPYGGFIRHFAGGFVDAGTLTAAANTTYTCVVTNSGTATVFRVNGVDRTSAGGNVTAPGRLIIGGTGAFAEPAGSYLLHLASYVGVLPLATIQSIESAMAATWGP